MEYTQASALMTQTSTRRARKGSRVFCERHKLGPGIAARDEPLQAGDTQSFPQDGLASAEVGATATRPDMTGRPLQSSKIGRRYVNSTAENGNGPNKARASARVLSLPRTGVGLHPGSAEMRSVVPGRAERPPTQPSKKQKYERPEDHRLREHNTGTLSELTTSGGDDATQRYPSAPFP